tara:strand:+ start:1949 stop:2665 length:717 start_codon:yes stop_codon:yes gene_type:complete
MKEKIRLNKYISNSGICSRREADKYITAGLISVNDIIISKLGSKVNENDIVKFNGQKVNIEKKIYVLLNKPKNYITTTKDPKNRKTVMELIKNSSKTRLYPVGRLDRKTTGLLLFTNDGEIAKKLTHPRYKVEKLYHVILNKNLKKIDYDLIIKGLNLEDGKVFVDELSYANNKKNELGVKIHIGKNRIIRRIFEKLNYNVIKLDRVMLAGLTKKNLQRGCWRYLNKQEIDFLQMLKK